MQEKNLSFIANIIDRTKKKGADLVDVCMVEGSNLSVGIRLGKLENFERAESSAFAIRAIINNQQAIISSTNKTEGNIEDLVDKVIAMAKYAPQDPYINFASETDLQKNNIDLDLYDMYEPSIDYLTDQVKTAENEALSIAGITNSEGAEIGYSTNNFVLGTSLGFVKGYRTSNSAISASVIAGVNTNMERDYAYSTKRHFKDLEKAEIIGRKAGERAIARLGAKKISTKMRDIIFDPRVARSIISSFASAINGVSIARKTSFLKDQMGQEIFNPTINIVDDPLIKKGLSSRFFDSEGVKCISKNMVENGRLVNWFLDLRSSKQLGLKTNGSAVRSLSSSPSPAASNLYVQPSTISKEDLIADIKDGIYITDLFGMGVNLITGDYSQGAFGFHIENGRISSPVTEFTIASNLKDMFKNMTVANDLEFHYSTNSPTMLIRNMMVAGG